MLPLKVLHFSIEIAKLFATGLDAKRRKGAKFCSNECKTKFNSLKRSR
jgi:hypothetical protein